MRITESRKRSLAKALSFRAIEIAVDALILSIFVETHVAIGLAVGLELVCLVLHFVFERIWNRIDYGRKVI